VLDFIESLLSSQISVYCSYHLSFFTHPPSSPMICCFLFSTISSNPLLSLLILPLLPLLTLLLTFPCFSLTYFISTCLLPELQFMVENHLYRQQQGAGDDCSSESCLSDRPSPDSLPTGEELPHDDEATAEAFEKLRCQMEGMFGV